VDVPFAPVGVVPALVARQCPGIEVQRLAACEHHPIDRAAAAEQFAARNRRALVRLDQGWLAGPSSQQQLYLVAGIHREPARHDRAGADDDVVIGLHLLDTLQTPLPVLIHALDRQSLRPLRSCWAESDADRAF
jgi:hypothetical protein